MSLAIGLALVAILMVIFRGLWNSTAPDVFGLREISNWQALKIQLPAEIRFGSHRVLEVSRQISPDPATTANRAGGVDVMNRKTSNRLAAVMIMILLLPLSNMASEGDSVKEMCKAEIEEVYGVNNFRNVSSEREGNRKYRVHGQEKFDNHEYDFNCKIKHGNVKPCACDGPHNRHNDKDDENSIAAAVAVGAGLAIITALAVSRASTDGHSDTKSSLPVSKSALKDECHDMLQYRIRDEHDYTARVNLKEARMKQHDLVARRKCDKTGSILTMLPTPATSTAAAGCWTAVTSYNERQEMRHELSYTADR